MQGNSQDKAVLYIVFRVAHRSRRSIQINGHLMIATDKTDPNQAVTMWNAVYAMAFCAAVMVGCEYLPVSLLSPIARDFDVTEGRAGLVISVSGIFAIVTSLTASRLTAGMDRSLVMLGFACALMVSNALVATASSFATLMLGRAVLGVAVGGFWSFSTAVTMRLLPAPDVPKGLALIGSAVAVATTISAPMASSLGEIIGWRGTFWALVPVAALAFCWLWISLPNLPPLGGHRRGGALGLLRRRQVQFATLGAMLLFMGQFVIFTYIRPLLETIAGFSVPAISGVLLAMGLSGVVGAGWGGRELRKSLFKPLIGIPAILSLIAVGMISFGTVQPAVVGLFMLWGFFTAAAGIGWGFWLSRALPDEAESGGGLQVAAIQLAIAGGAFVGGWVLDHSGWQASIGVGVVVLIMASLAATATAIDFKKERA